MRRALEIIFMSLVVLAVVQSIIVGATEMYRLYRGKGTITYYNIPFQTDKATYAPGDGVHFFADVAVIDLATARSTYVITPELHRVGCDSVYQLTTFTTASSLQRQDVNYTITIPKDVPSGQYEVRGVSRWSNDSASGGVAWNTVTFNVTTTGDEVQTPCDQSPPRST